MIESKRTGKRNREREQTHLVMDLNGGAFWWGCLNLNLIVAPSSQMHRETHFISYPTTTPLGCVWLAAKRRFKFFINKNRLVKVDPTRYSTQ